MRLAVWDTPPAAFLVSGLDAGAVKAPVSLERHDAHTCTRLLESGRVDVALLPSLVVLSHADAFDVLPGAALSTWKCPYARLVLRRGLERVETVAFDPMHAQEALVARIILKEHYGCAPDFAAVEAAALEQGDHDAFLVSGPQALTLQTEHLALDLGEEWYELVNYPMVWGLFAARRDEATPALLEALLEVTRAAEQQRPVWTQAREMTPEAHAFFSDDLRLRFDDLATASLTELRQYLYFYHVTEEIPDLPLFLLPDDQDDDEPTPLL